MSYTFLLEQGEESSAECFSDIPASVLSNGIITPANASSPDNGTDACHTSLSGTTCKPLTENLGAGASMSSAGAFRAKTSAQPARAQESTANALECGTTWLESWARYDRASSSWKTHQCLWVEDLPWSSVTLPKWGMTRSGALFQHPTAERPISATASGLWQTIVTDDAASRPGGKQNSRGEPKLSAEMMLWPTPTVHGNHNQPGSSKNAGWGLSSAVKLWPTPTRSDGTGGPGNQGRSGGPNLRTAVSRSWPTPCASASKGSSPASLVRKTGKSRSNDRIDHAVMASDGGQLNPAWVEWLMGWPIGWTELKPLAMDKFREWQQQHSPCWPEMSEAP